jgi:hypothetical protein
MMDDDGGGSYPVYPQDGSSSGHGHFPALPSIRASDRIIELSSSDMLSDQVNRYESNHHLGSTDDHESTLCDLQTGTGMVDTQMSDLSEADKMANDPEDIYLNTTPFTLPLQAPVNHPDLSSFDYAGPSNAANQDPTSAYVGALAGSYSGSFNPAFVKNDPSSDFRHLLDLFSHDNPPFGSFSLNNSYEANQPHIQQVNSTYRPLTKSQHSEDIGLDRADDDLEYIFDYNNRTIVSQHDDDVGHIEVVIHSQPSNDHEDDDDLEPGTDISNDVDHHSIQNATIGDEAEPTEDSTDAQPIEVQSSDTAPSMSRKRKRGSNSGNIVSKHQKNLQLFDYFQASIQPGCVLVRPGLPGSKREGKEGKTSIYLCNELWMKILELLDITEYLNLYRYCPQNLWLRNILSDSTNLAKVGIARAPARMSIQTYMSLLSGSGCMKCTRHADHKNVSWSFALRLCRKCRKTEIGTVGFFSIRTRKSMPLILLTVR